MAVKVIKEEREEFVNRVDDAFPTWLTLTKHPVNSQGFRIVKSDDEGGEAPEETKFLQAVLIPNDQVETIDALAESAGAPWLHDLKKSDTKARGAFTEFVQTPKKVFEEDTLTFEPIGDSRAIMVVGQKKADMEMTGDMVTVPVTTRVDETPIESVAVPPITMTFSDLFRRELDGFLDVVSGTVKQQHLSAGERKKAVMNAHKALGQFLSAGLDKLNDAVNGKMSKADFSAEVDKIRDSIDRADAQKTAITQEADDMTKEEIQEIVTAAVGAVMQKSDAPPATPTAPEVPAAPAATPESTATTDKLAAIEAKLEALGASVTAVMEKHDKLANSLGAEPKNDQPADGTALTKADPADIAKLQEYLSKGVPKEERGAVWNGTLFDWKGYQEQINALTGQTIQ